MSLSEDKAVMRRLLTEEMNRLPPEYERTSNDIITLRFTAMEEYLSAGRVFFYSSVGHEVSTKAMIEHAVGLGKQILLPRTGKGGEMTFADASGGLVPGRYGIPEPGPEEPAVEPTAGDIIVVPAICCDTRCYRLGHGGGYYDRYLAKYPDAVRIGLCRRRMLTRFVPADWNDVRLDYVITEEEIIKA